jgi:catechol 2,3-dioxygenase-like lactoylglutathione lyase family enzyme
MSSPTFNHVSVTCADFERSLAFYTGMLGLPLLDSDEVSSVDSPEHRMIIGLGDVRLRIAEIGLGEGARLEVIEYLEPRGKATTSRTCDPGNVHVALTVDDGIEDLHQRLLDAGVTCRSAPMTLTHGRWKGARAFYALDPDGVTVELIQFPPGFGA